MNQLELFPTTEPIQETSAPSRAASPLDTSHTANQDSKSRNQKSGHASVFDQFTDDQLLQIVDWLADHTYNQTRGLIKDNYHREISHGAIQRFFERTSFLEHLDQSEQAAVAAREILRNTVSNQVKYSEATLRLLEQTAFNLALTSRTRPRDLDPLNRINNIICRSRNTAVRERHATVQEKKTDLRTRELDLKTQILHARLDGRLTLNRNLNPTRNLFSEDPQNSDPTPIAAEVGPDSPSGPSSRDAISYDNATSADQPAHSIQSDI